MLSSSRRLERAYTPKNGIELILCPQSQTQIALYDLQSCWQLPYWFCIKKKKKSSLLFDYSIVRAIAWTITIDVASIKVARLL